MRQRAVTLATMVGVVVLTFGLWAQAAETESPTAAPPNAWTEFWNTFHHPNPYLEMGLDHRFRTIYAENIDTLNKESVDNRYDFQRYRTRWWTKWILDEDVSFHTRLAWEFRTWDDPPKKPQDVDFDEALFDNFYVNVNNLFGLPLSARIGRQDMLMAYGVGWLVMDGTPLDGSRTFFLDAARFTYDWTEKNTKVDFVYIDHGVESDRWLEPISDENRALTPADERGLILYLTNKSLAKTQLEGFFMYKNDNPPDSTVEEMPAFWTRKAEILTFGGAISGTPAERWKYRVEGAIQTGEKSDITSDYSAGEMQDLEAYGALANLEYSFQDKLENSLHIGGEYASGDDPDTDDNEQFDLLWAKWPRWSELFIYTYTQETMIADSTNLIRLNVGHKFRPHKNWQISTDYHALWADETGVPWSPGLTLDDDSNFRGHLITCWANYTFGKQLKGHLLGEYFFPGDYYASANDDEALWLRFNLEYTF
ncbi:MAG: alginate export family protein [Phycisphaerae bacterium]|nr:alginate export family protein [Phycisphaerae bacterium]